jgi:ribosomal-protein-alanine N-acetyltransferase
MTVQIAALDSIEEIDEVLEIEHSSFTNPWTRAMYEADLENREMSHVFIARDETRRALAFCSFWIVLDELHVNNLAVLPERRREGLASQLLQAVMVEAGRLGAVRATLEVRRSNEAAIRLYSRWGFLPSGVRRGYYSAPNEDALVLWREGLPKG